MKLAEIEGGKRPSGALTTAEREDCSSWRRENKQLRMEREILKKSGGPLRQGKPEVRIDQGGEANYPITVLCRVLNVSAQRISRLVQASCV